MLPAFPPPRVVTARPPPPPPPEVAFLWRTFPPADAGFAPDGDLPPAPTEVADAGVGILLGGWSKICCSFRKVLSSHRFLIYERMCPRLVFKQIETTQL